jgi:hypothetical protein
LTEYSNLSEAETEMVVVMVKTVKRVEVTETVAVVMTMAAVTVKMAATIKTAKTAEATETAVTIMTAAEGTAKTAVMIETAVAVMAKPEKAYWRGHWFISCVSEVRIMWNITAGQTENTGHCKGLMR